MHYSSWSGPALFAEIAGFALSDKSVLTVQLAGGKKRGLEIKMKKSGKGQQQALDAINQYYVRYRMAVEYQNQKRIEAQRT